MSAPSGPDASNPPGDAFATFRPRRGRAVAFGVAWASLAVFGGLAVLIRGDRPGEEQAVSVLERRIAGVITARTYVMLDYDCPKELVDKATELTPGLESPTVSPMQDDAWVAVRAMVPRIGRNRLMDELYDLGARAILVTDIAACRL